MKPFQLLIKPSGPDCNLNCTYCFYRRVSQLFSHSFPHRMKKEVLEEMLRQHLSLQLPFSVFSWQGGEPTLCALSFFEEVVKLQMKHGHNKQVVSNSLQTNGILLDKNWCQFFKEYKFFIGLSLDGPKEIHDKFRLGGKKGSWEKAMRAARLLSQYRIDFNILTVLTRESEGKAKMFFHWFLEHGFRYLQFIPCLEKSPSGKGIASFSISAQGYGDFLCDLFDTWWENDRTVSIRTFESVLENLVLGYTNFCIFSPVCQGYLLVEHNGSVYPCDFFVKEDTSMGNLMQTPLDKIFSSRCYEKFGQRKSMVSDECKECSHLRFCYGGCQKNRIDQEGKQVEKTFFCSSYKQFFCHAFSKLSLLAEEIKNKNKIRV